MTQPPGELLTVEGLSKHFPITRGVLGRTVGHVRAVDGVSFSLGHGETLGLVGESGSGKTTAGRAILRLIEPTAGRVLFDGADVTAASPSELRALRRRMQMVFQDPYGSLNPRMRVIDIIGEPIEQHGLLKGPAVERRVAELLERVGLSRAWINRYPHEFSGGQRQRLGVARAIALEPKLVICDEPVSALDVSVQAQVINLLRELGRELGLSYLFIAHDLSVVRHISDRVAVMYLGEIAEIAESRRLFTTPSHPYTRSLLSAVPIPDPTRERRRLVLHGDIPSPLNPPSGCRFHTRCPAVFERCPGEAPRLIEVTPGHYTRCFHAYDLAPGDPYPQLNERIERQIQDNSRQSGREGSRSAPLLSAALLSEPPSRDEPVPDRKPEHDAPAAPQRFKPAVWVVLGLALLAALIPARRFYLRDRAERTLGELAQAVEERRANTGTYPSSLEELGFRLPSIFRGRKWVDPWGRPFTYRAPAKDGDRPELSSLGPDGIPSQDDIRLR